MKKITYPLFIAFGLIIVSCKKDNPTPTSGNPALRSFYFKKDGVAYDPAVLMKQHVVGKIIMTTSTTANETVRLNIEDSLVVGDYNFTPDGPFRMFYTPDNFTTNYVSKSGTGTIVSHDKTHRKIQATFSCILVSDEAIPDTIYITNGEVNQTY